MSEQASSPAAEDTSAPGLATEAPAATETDEDLSTDHIDRVEAEDENQAAKKSRIAAEGGDGPEGEGAEGAATVSKADDGTVEVEAPDGSKVKVPAALKDDFLRHADYTRKTQELSVRTRDLDTQVQTFQQQREESLAALPEEYSAVAVNTASMNNAQTEVTEYEKIDWATWRAQTAALADDDPNKIEYKRYRAGYDAARENLADAQRALGSAKQALTTKEQARLDEQAKGRETAIATARQETGKVLTSEGWDQQRFADTASYAVTELGYSPDELVEAIDPRAWRMADKLRSLSAENAKLKASQKQTATALSNVKAQESRPVEPAKGNAQPTRPRDDNSTEAWMDRRNRQVAAKQAKARAAR